MKGQATLFSSVNQNWRTPQRLFAELDNEFHFVLDAAASPENAKCGRYFTEEDDALKQNWDVGGAVWCNPPYGRNIHKWVKKAYEEHKRTGVTIVMLLFAKTDTMWFHRWIYHEAEFRFVEGRLKFEDENGVAKWNAPAPSMIVIWRGGDAKR